LSSFLHRASASANSNGRGEFAPAVAVKYFIKKECMNSNNPPFPIRESFRPAPGGKTRSRLQLFGKEYEEKNL